MSIKLGVKINHGKTEVTYCDVPDLAEVKRLYKLGHTPAAIKELLKKGKRDAARADRGRTRSGGEG